MGERVHGKVTLGEVTVYVAEPKLYVPYKTFEQG